MERTPNTGLLASGKESGRADLVFQVMGVSWALVLLFLAV